MIRFPKSKIMFFFLMLYFTFSFLPVDNHDADEHDHACIEENCLVCLRIEMTKKLLKVVKIAAPLAPSSHLAFQFQINDDQTGFRKNLLSPVLLKDRINT